MHPRISFTRALGAFFIAGALLLAGTGCSSDRGRGPGGGERRQPPTPLAGQETFFDGQLLAKVTVGNEGMPQIRAGGGSGGERSGPGGGGGRRRGAGGGAPGGGGGFGGAPREGGGPGGGEGPTVRPMAGGGGGMPQIIHVSFTNQGSAPLDVFIYEFASLLGNFAVRPEKLTLAPGETLETESMSTQLGGRYSEVDARLVLRVGDKKETKTFRLVAVTPTPSGPPPPAANPAAKP